MSLIFGLPANVVYFTAGIYVLLIVAMIVPAPRLAKSR